MNSIANKITSYVLAAMAGISFISGLSIMFGGEYRA